MQQPSRQQEEENKKKKKIRKKNQMKYGLPSLFTSKFFNSSYADVPTYFFNLNLTF
jgi:hypothetical protein